MHKFNINSAICIVAMIVIGAIFGYQQLQPKQAIAQGDSIDLAIQLEGDRLRREAGRDEPCIQENSQLAGEAKDKAIVRCFLSRLEVENREAIAQQLLRQKALEEAKNGKR